MASEEVLNGSLRREDDSVIDTFTFIDPPSIAAGTCDINVLSGGVFALTARAARPHPGARGPPLSSRR